MTIEYWKDDVLLGDSHNAFVGKVIDKVWSGTLPYSRTASSRYTVNVIYNIKGHLAGDVIVNQFEFDTPFLKVGSTYVFVARYERTDNTYLIVYYPHQYQLISDDSSLTAPELTTQARKNDRVKALETAYPNEHLAGSDIRDHMTWNSYASRHWDAAGNLIDDTVELGKKNGFLNADGTPISPTPTPIQS